MFHLLFWNETASMLNVANKWDLWRTQTSKLDPANNREPGTKEHRDQEHVRYIYQTTDWEQRKHKGSYEKTTLDVQLGAVHIHGIMCFNGLKNLQWSGGAVIMWYKSDLSENYEFTSCNYKVYEYVKGNPLLLPL